MIKALIIEDENLIAKELQYKIKEITDDIEIVQVLPSVKSASKWFVENSEPDLIFADIQLSDGTSFEIFQQFDLKCPVIFTTAYDEYAVKAFENGAADYLMKPVEIDRLVAAVARIKKRLGTAPVDLTGLIGQLLNQGAKAGTSKLKWIRASLGNQTKLINVEEVLFFQSDTKYTRIVQKDGEALVRTPLKELIEGLDEDVFWQVHRGVIINAHAIDRAVREGPEKLVVHIKGLKETLPVSRQYFHLFKQS